MMNATFVTTLTTQELQELIELSVKNAVQVSPKMSNEDDTLLDTNILPIVRTKKLGFN